MSVSNAQKKLTGINLPSSLRNDKLRQADSGTLDVAQRQINPDLMKKRRGFRHCCFCAVTHKNQPAWPKSG